MIIPHLSGSITLGEIILWLTMWYCRYALSYHDLKEMAMERGLKLERSTIYRWVQEYGPEISKRVKPYFKTPCNSYKVDETYGAPILRKLHEVLTGARARLEYISVVIDGIIRLIFVVGYATAKPKRQ